MDAEPRTTPLRTMLRDIIAGDETTPAGAGAARGASRVLSGEDGLVAWATLVAVLFFAVLAALVFNVGYTINQKIETQNAADSVAYSGALWLARGMNAITAGNHMMGELTALYVLHHALGGKYLDDHYQSRRPNSGPPQIVAANWSLDWGWNLARITIIDSPRPRHDHYDRVRRDPVADERSTLFEAKLRLKWLMFSAYLSHVGGQILAFVPQTRPLGLLIMGSAYVLEWKIWQEYLFLDVVEEVAIGLGYLKTRILPNALAMLWFYQRVVVHYAPWRAWYSAYYVGRQNHAVGALAYKPYQYRPYDNWWYWWGYWYWHWWGVPLPIEPERTQDETRSQLMRATYPWVHYWRVPIRRVFAWTATLSGAAGYYMKWTNTYSLEVCQDFRRNRGYRLAVLQELNPPSVDKSQEPWAVRSGRYQAECMFCVLGLARKPDPPPLAARAFFRQANPDGVVCFAQAMIYNANPQQRPAPSGGGGSPQPRVGWDTLAWTANAVEWGTTSTSARRPEITLNWQAKLVPATYYELRKAWYYSSIPDSRMRYVLHTRNFAGQRFWIVWSGNPNNWVDRWWFVFH